MTTNSNPALNAFLESFEAKREWAQILIRRSAAGFEVLHALDAKAEDLRQITLAELRKIALFNAAGDFRPIKAAPDLQRGWRLVCRDAQELWRALQELYPGSIADWHAASTGTAVATDYRPFTNRQSGMYRITTLLADEQAAHVIRACCAPRFCLKNRHWTVAGLPADEASTKSGIPCLEPCAVLLELARKAARIEQEEKPPASLANSEIESAISALEIALAAESAIRAGDIGNPLNPRRLQLLLEKLKPAVKRSPETEG